jgi:outer membrane protein assembly factor BamB
MNSLLYRASLLCGLALCCTLPAGDWPRFQGQNGTGHSNEQGIPVKWTEKDHVFKVKIPGLGNGSPIVSNGKVFVHTSSESGDERSLLCLDANNGKTLWTKTVKGEKAKINSLNSLASSTPAADGERVVCAYWTGKEVVLHAYDFQGNELWSHSMGGFGRQHGAAASPVIYDGKVIFLHDQDKERAANPDRAAVLVCLDATKGKVLWEKTRPAYRACYSIPFVKEGAGGKKELIVVTTLQITSYGLEDGKENWRFDWKFATKPLRTVGSGILADDMVIACSGDGDGSRHMIAVKAGGQGTLPAKNLMWEHKTARATPYVPCVISSGDHLYCFTDSGFALCLSARDGKEVYRERLGSTVTASPVLINDKLYVAGYDGKVYVVEASPKYNVLARNDLGDSVSASPAVADGRIYFRTRTQLICVGKK